MSMFGNGIIPDVGNDLAERGVATSNTFSPTAALKDIAAAKGLKLGIAYKPDNPADTAPYRALVLEQAGLLIPEVAVQSNVWCPTTRGVYTWTRFDQFVTLAKSAGLPWKVPSGFIYPAHDMDWVSTVDGNGVIQPVNDGTGNPAVRASTYQAIIDELVAAFKARCDFHNSYPMQINASNELIDPVQANGWRRHPWYTATNGPAWLAYLIQKLKATFPTIPIGICQDMMEQPGVNNYGTNLRTAFINNLDALIALGAKPDYVDFQCHLRDDRFWDPLALRTAMRAIKAKGIKLIIGELDCRVVTPANYTNPAFDRLTAYMIDQALSVMLPELDGGLLGIWCLSDLVQGWGAGQRACLYDSALAVKPAYFTALAGNLSEL